MPHITTRKKMDLIRSLNQAGFYSRYTVYFRVQDRYMSECEFLAFPLERDSVIVALGTGLLNSYREFTWVF